MWGVRCLHLLMILIRKIVLIFVNRDDRSRNFLKQTGLLLPGMWSVQILRLEGWNEFYGTSDASILVRMVSPFFEIKEHHPGIGASIWTRRPFLCTTFTRLPMGKVLRLSESNASDSWTIVFSHTRWRPSSASGSPKKRQTQNYELSKKLLQVEMNFIVKISI